LKLSEIFSAVAHKQLVSVDLPKVASNQHELNGISALKNFFGVGKPIKGILSWCYFGDDQEPSREDGAFTFYDARAKSANKTGRSEWRFYYQGNFLSKASIGDWFFLARSQSGQLFALVFQKNSAFARAAKVLFGIEKSTQEFSPLSSKHLDAKKIALVQQQILSELDLQIAIPSKSIDEQIILDQFGKKFPTTKEMSKFARENVEVDFNNSDETLVRWLEREEQLFRALENVIIGERLKQGFKTVDEFIEYSLSAQNRRKSRMGLALQNHLSEIFVKQGLRFTAQAKTEANNRPDFIFPGEKEYHDAKFDPELLVMLGVKSTSKDRWRQVLTEADRIPSKHLCTLEAGISTKQTDEMVRQNLTLVLPEAMHETYTVAQRRKLLTLGGFVKFVRAKQA
jgi:hypothetical protein